jgi:hypothetical protein
VDAGTSPNFRLSTPVQGLECGLVALSDRAQQL